MAKLNLLDYAGDEKIDINCSECNHNFKIKLKQIGKSVKCPKCQVEINLEKNKDFDKQIRALEKTIEQFMG